MRVSKPQRRGDARYRDYSKAWERYHLAGEPPTARPCPPVPRWLAWVAAVAVLLAIEAVGALAGLWRLGMLR